MWKVYILLSTKKRKTYTGSTDNFSRRLEQHNKGLVQSTKSYRPWMPIYIEFYPTEKDARAREKYLKGASGRKQIKTQINEIINTWIGSSTG